MHNRVTRYLLGFTGVLAVVGIGTVSINAARRIFIRADIQFNPVSTPKVTAQDTSTTIEWSTRAPVLSVIQYGGNVDSLHIPAFETKETSDHKITIRGLLAQTTYYYRIFTNNQPYPPLNQPPLSFSTLASLSPAPVYPPCLLTVFEEYYGSQKSDSRYKAEYDIYPADKPDGVINAQDYLECIRVKPVQ